MGSWVSIFWCFILKHGKELESVIFLEHIFCGIKAQILGYKKNTVSVPYITAFGFLAYNSLRILKLYRIISLTLKTSLSIAGDRPYVGIYKFQLQDFGHFFDES